MSLVGRGNGFATVAQVCATARSLVNSPYQHKGRVPGVALDCVGVLTATAQALDLCTHDLADYSRWTTDDTLQHELNACLIRIGDADPDLIEPGVALGFIIGRRNMHTGIAVPHANGIGMVHAYIGRNRTIEHILDDKWHRRLIGIWAFPGVKDYKWQQSHLQ